MESVKKVAFITLGCKVNISETEGMKQLFQQAGYKIVGGHEAADVYVVNTCTVTAMSDKKSRQMLRRSHSLNPEAIVVAAGCFAQVSPQEAAKIKGVNLILGNNMKHRIVELVEDIQKQGEKQFVMERKALNEYEEMGVENYEGHTRAFLKIQDGCDQFCSYCIIPYARGPIRSRRMEDVIKEAENFAKNGFREVVLTGIHLASYGSDRKINQLPELIKKIHSIDGIKRIRLGSLEPMFLTSELVEEIKDLPKLCPHFHISLQSGCGATLKRMNRKYTPEDYRKIVFLLKEKIPDMTLTTDVMVGFPGETDDDFIQSYDFCREMGFLWMHVFKYSPRKGTPAAKFPEQIESRIKEIRSKKLIELATKMRVENLKRFIGRNMEVLLEQELEQGSEGGPQGGSSSVFEGLTANYLPVMVKGGNIKAGEIIEVCLSSIEGERIQGIF